MSGTNDPHVGLTRRTFLKTTAVAAGTTAVTGTVPLAALAAEGAPTGEEGRSSPIPVACTHRAISASARLLSVTATR